MKTFTRVALATFAMAAFPVAAFAQPVKPDTGAKKAPVEVKGGIAVKVDPKAPAKPEKLKVPQEVTELAKLMVGTWRCKGEGSEMDGSKKPMTATNRTKVDLDKWWIVDTFDGRTGTGPTATTFKFVSYSTFDAASKKWRRVMMDNQGGHMVGTSDGLKDNRMTFNMDAWSPMMPGAAMFRDNVDATDAKAGLKFSGEMSVDKGKSWVKVYEMTCKK